jgi:hypothetical protein
MNKEEIDIILRQAWELEREEKFKASINSYDKAIAAMKLLVEDCKNEDEKEMVKGLIKEVVIHNEELRKAAKVKILPPPVNPIHPTHVEGLADCYCLLK